MSFTADHWLRKWVCSMGMFWSTEATEATASMGNFFAVLALASWQNRFIEKFWDIKCDFAVWLSFCLLECWEMKLKAVLLWVMISDWMRIWPGLWLGPWVQTFCKFISCLSNRREWLVRFMNVCVEYDRYNRVCYEGHVIVIDLPMQSPRGGGRPTGLPLAPALVRAIVQAVRGAESFQAIVGLHPRPKAFDYIYRWERFSLDESGQQFMAASSQIGSR